MATVRVHVRNFLLVPLFRPFVQLLVGLVNVTLEYHENLHCVGCEAGLDEDRCLNDGCEFPATGSHPSDHGAPVFARCLSIDVLLQ